MRIDVKENKIEETKNVPENADAKEIPPVPDERIAARLRTAMNFSVLGLILSVFAGVGLFFGVAGVIIGVKYRGEGETASRYAVGIGIAAAVLSLVFGALFAAALVLTVFG